MIDTIMVYVGWAVVIALFTLPQLWFISFALTLKAMAWRIITGKNESKPRPGVESNSQK